jgi:hypothetical protein
MGTGTELTIKQGETIIKAKTYFDFDGKDKVEIDGKVFEYCGGFTLKKEN